MDRRVVGTLGVTWLCWMLTFFPGLPASPVTSSQRLPTPVYTNAATPVTHRTQGAFKTRQDASEDGSATFVTPGHHTVNTLDASQLITLTNREKREDCACTVSLGYGQSMVVAEAGRVSFGYQRSVYYSAGQDFSGITIHFTPPGLEKRFPIGKHKCLSGSTWKRFYFEAYCAHSQFTKVWYLSVNVGNCNLKLDTEEQCGEGILESLKLSAHGSSCWRGTEPSSRCSSLTTDTDTVRTVSPTVTRSSSDDGDKTQIPSQDVEGEDTAQLPSQDVEGEDKAQLPFQDGPQEGCQQETIILVASVVVVVVVVVVIALIIQQRMTSKLRAAGDKSGAVVWSRDRPCEADDNIYEEINSSGPQQQQRGSFHDSENSMYMPFTEINGCQDTQSLPQHTM